MCEPVTTALIIATVVAAGSTTYTGVEGKNKERAMEDAAGKQEQDQARMIAEAEAEKGKQDKAQSEYETSESIRVAAQQQKLNDQKLRNAARTSRTGRSGTIMTSPLGINPLQPAKTLLGA